MPSRKQYDQHIASQRHRDNEAVYLRGIYEGITFVAFGMDIAAATDSLPPAITHHSVATTLDLSPALPANLNAMDHDAFLASLNQLVDHGVDAVNDSLLGRQQEHRWSEFLKALRAGVPSVLDYELKFEADEEEEAEFDDAGDSYAGYDDCGAGGGY